MAYARARRRFEIIGEAVGEARALRGQAQVYLDTVQPARAEPLLRLALNKVRRTAKDERAMLLVLLAENKINAGQLPQAERLHRAVYRAAQRDDIPPMDPRVYVRDGRFALARQIVESGLRADPWGVGQWRAPRSHREAAVLLAWIDAMTGEATSARRYADQSRELGRALSSPIVECVSLARLGHGWLSGSDFDVARARACYDDSRLIAERIGVPRFKVESLLGLTLVAGLEGKMAEAEANAREAIAILEDAGDQYLCGILYLALGAAAVLGSHPNAERWLNEAARLGRASGDRFGQCATDLWLAVFHHRAGRQEEASVAIARVLTTAQMHGFDFLFTHVPLLGPKDQAARRELYSLIRTVRQDDLGPYVARLLRETQPIPSAKPSTTPSITVPIIAPLYVQTLGPFRVWRDGREIERRAWGREKALHLLQYLVCQRGRFVHREQILDALWPDVLPAAAATGLRVALSTLRKTLSIGPEAGIEFIRREGEGLQLNLVGKSRVDADEFAQLVQTARSLEADDIERATRCYESALILYHGDFLDENPYAEWAMAERERLLAGYLSAAERLARLWVQQGDCEQGARWANAILSKDALWEEAYALLMECYWRQGNRALAIRTFERCRKRLREALSIEPSPRTVQLFEAISRV